MVYVDGKITSYERYQQLCEDEDFDADCEPSLDDYKRLFTAFREFHNTTIRIGDFNTFIGSLSPTNQRLYEEAEAELHKITEIC